LIIIILKKPYVCLILIFYLGYHRFLIYFFIGWFKSEGQYAPTSKVSRGTHPHCTILILSVKTVRHWPAFNSRTPVFVPCLACCTDHPGPSVGNCAATQRQVVTPALKPRSDVSTEGKVLDRIVDFTQTQVCSVWFSISYWCAGRQSKLP